MATSELQILPFPTFLGRHLRAERHELTSRWVATLSEQLDVDAREVLPEENLLNEIPVVLDRIADFVEDPEDGPLEALVVEDLGRLAELRRRQGFGLEELLREYHILSELVRESAAKAAATYQGPSRPEVLVWTMGRLMDSIHLISAVTARSFRVWRNRYDRERFDLLETFGQVMAHELGNRLGAAETAIRFLLSQSDVSEDHRDRLYELILRSIRGGLQTVEDVGVLARPPLDGAETAGISLWLVIKESVRLVGGRADRRGVSVSIVGEVPDVRVPGSPIRIALANLLSNAVKYHRAEGDDRWVRVSAARSAESDGVEIVVEDNGPGIEADLADRVFDYRYRGEVIEDGSGLGLAITRDVVERVGGSVSLREGGEGGARFVVRVPESGAAKDG